MQCPGLELEFQGRCIGPAEQQRIGPTLCKSGETWDPNAMTEAQGKIVQGGCRRVHTMGDIGAAGALVGVALVLGLAYMAGRSS